MKDQKENIEKQEFTTPRENKDWKEPKNIDTPKPDPETVSSNEEDEEVVKPGENIFK